MMNQKTPYIYYALRTKAKIVLRLCGILLFSSLGSITMTSCFTGIESTKKISLSREDRKILAPTPEEEYFKGVASEPLSAWKKGKQFIAADNKTLLIFTQHSLPIDPDSAAIKGSILYFEGIEPKMEPDGTSSATLIFKDNRSYYRYNTGKPFSKAGEMISSDQIPMMIDLDMVKEADKLLSGNKFCLRSPLWYDINGNRISGKKFIEVTIQEVRPGDISFPLKLRFYDNAGNEGWIFMNYGNLGTETRLFSNLFFLNDIRKKYPSITDETWEYICEGKVKLGMTKEECKLSLGNPNDVSRGHDYSQTLDLWQYPDGTVLWFEDGLLSRYRR